KINGKYIVNPERQLLKEATLDIIIAATNADVMMVEGEAQECQESELVEAIKIGHEAIKVQCKAQLELAALIGESIAVKRENPSVEVNENLKAEVVKFATDRILVVGRGGHDKVTRKKAFDTIKEELKAHLLGVYGE